MTLVDMAYYASAAFAVCVIAFNVKQVPWYYGFPAVCSCVCLMFACVFGAATIKHYVAALLSATLSVCLAKIASDRARELYTIAKLCTKMGFKNDCSEDKESASSNLAKMIVTLKDEIAYYEKECRRLGGNSYPQRGGKDGIKRQ